MIERAIAASTLQAGSPVAADRTRSEGGRPSAGSRAASGDTLATKRLRLAAAGDATMRAIVDRLLLRGPISAAEIASDLDLDAQAVRHLLRRLLKGGIVERGEKSNRRGVLEFLYSCDLRRSALSSDICSGLPADQVERALTRVLRELFRETKAASESGSYFAREEFINARFPLPLDEQGWRRAGLLHTRLLDTTAAAAKRAAARLSQGAEPIDVTAATLLFQIPGSRWPAPFADGEPLPEQIRRRPKRRQPISIVAHTEPLRLKIVDTLTLRPAAAVELAAEIGAPLERIRYELRVLERAAMVKVHSRREQRGAMENVFIADPPRMTFFAEDASNTSDLALRDFVTEWTRLVFGEAVQSIREGSFRDRSLWHLTRTPLRLDSQGFIEISASFDITLEGLFDLREACLARQVSGGAAAFPGFFNLLLFEKAVPSFEHS